MQTPINAAALASSADGCKLVAATSSSPGSIYISQITPTPVLNITNSTNGLLLSWLVPSQSFVLQQSSDLGTTNWSDVPTSPVLNYSNLQNEVLIPVPISGTFFRLVSR